MGSTKETLATPHSEFNLSPSAAAMTAKRTKTQDVLLVVRLRSPASVVLLAR